MLEMKSGEVVLRLAAQLASWRAVLVLVRTWATCKPWQRKDFHQYSTFLADCLNQSKQIVWESAGGGTATESRKVGKGRRKRRYADVDGPGANPEPELGPRGPALKKQVLKGFDWLDLRLGLQPADSVDITQDFEWEKETRARHKDYNPANAGPRCRSARLFELEKTRARQKDLSSLGELVHRRVCQAFLSSGGVPEEGLEAMDPAVSPSSTRKVADTARPSSSSPVATVPGWRSFLCFGNGK